MWGLKVAAALVALALAAFWAWLTTLWMTTDVANPHWIGYAGMVVAAVAGIGALFALTVAALDRLGGSRMFPVWLGVSVVISAIVWLMSGVMLSSN